MLVAKALTVSLATVMAIWPLECFTHATAATAGFQSGIRVITYLGYYSTAGASDPIGDVLDTGQLTLSFGDSKGTDEYYHGLTDLVTGIDDHPNAIVDATWNFQTNWEDANPACDADPTMNNVTGRHVPLEGYIEQVICII